MYRDGFCVVGPSRPSKCKTRVANVACSQSSINSHKCDKPLKNFINFLIKFIKIF